MGAGWGGSPAPGAAGEGAALLPLPLDGRRLPPQPLPHSARPRPQNSAQPRLPTEPGPLAAAQRREAAPLAGADVIPLLRAALAAEQRPHTQTYLCGELGAAL
jgi:hypothetical protein